MKYFLKQDVKEKENRINHSKKYETRTFQNDIKEDYRSILRENMISVRSESMYFKIFSVNFRNIFYKMNNELNKIQI